MTSQGPHINGLDARKWISAGYACHIYGSKKKAYVRPGYEQRDDISTPVVNITAGTTVGFRYLQFGNNSPKSVTVVMEEAKKVTVNVRIDSYKGRIIAAVDLDESGNEGTAMLNTGVVGKHAVYFEFVSDRTEEAYSFDKFSFD